MPDEALSAGAYVICNQKTSTVLHIEVPDVSHERTSLQAFQQNEGQFKDQQIWWIEPLTHYDNEVYSITSPGSGKSLDGDPESGWVYANKQHGDPWKRWRLHKVTDPDNNEVSYNIVNAFNGKVVDIEGDDPKSGAWVSIQQNIHSRRQNRWKFEIPVVAFPPGWFHIQNVGTRNLLSHDYDHNPPVLLKPPESPVESQFREQWGFQWTLSHSKGHKSKTADERNSWCIINRLTKSRLSPHFGTMEEKDFAGRDDNLDWKLTLDTSCNWKITNLSTSCLLQQMDSVSGGGTAVGCSDPGFTSKDGRQSWILRPPLLHGASTSPREGITQEPPPPEYASPEG